jgi:hypothetical protein
MRWWVATGRVRSLLIRAERWFDARDVARTLLGAEFKSVEPLGVVLSRKPKNFVSVEWKGNAAGANTLRRVVRAFGRQATKVHP